MKSILRLLIEVCTRLFIITTTIYQIYKVSEMSWIVEITLLIWAIVFPIYDYYKEVKKEFEKKEKPIKLKEYKWKK